MVKSNKEMYGHSHAVSYSVRMAIHFFVTLTFSNGCILLTIGSIYSKAFLHFMTTYVDQWLLVPSPSRFEIRQWPKA